MRLVRYSFLVTILVSTLLTFTSQTAYSATHRLSEFKKLYATFYLFPRDMDMLKTKTENFILTEDPSAAFKDTRQIKEYLQAFNKLKQKLIEKGFILTANPEDADAIAAFRVQIGSFDIITGSYCGHTASLRILDPATKDALMIMFTEGSHSLITSSIEVETDKLLNIIENNI